MANELSRLLGVHRFKNPRESMFFEKDSGYFTRAMKYGDPVVYELLKQTGLSVILDRSYPSEYCYSQAFERATDWGMLRIIDDLAASIGTRIIVPYRTDYGNAKDDFKAITRQKLERLHGLYEEFCGWTHCEVLRLCVDDEDLKREMSVIVPFVMGDRR